MAKKFALVGGTADVLNVFDGDTGTQLSSNPLPEYLGSDYSVDMSYDGNIVAVTAWVKNYVWFKNLSTGAETQVSCVGFVNAGRGFDGAGAFYVGGNGQYLRILAPYGASTTVATSAPVTVFPNQVPELSACRVRNPDTGEQSLYTFNLVTGVIGDTFGFDVDGSVLASVDTTCTHILTSMPTGYGIRIWDYATLEFNDYVGPASGAGTTQTRRGVAFTSDGAEFVIKTRDNYLGIGTFGGLGIRSMVLDAVLDYSADNAYTVVEGMLDDTHVLLSSLAIQNMLVSFNLITGAVDWENSNGHSLGSSTQDGRYVGVQPTTGPGATPPDPPTPPAEGVFWTGMVQCIEVV